MFFFNHKTSFWNLNFGDNTIHTQIEVRMFLKGDKNKRFILI